MTNEKRKKMYEAAIASTTCSYCSAKPGEPCRQKGAPPESPAKTKPHGARMARWLAGAIQSETP